jgi:hypothetical protein
MERINYRYNLREKANYIACAVLGAAIPIAFTRYQMANAGLETKTIGQEALAWFTATVASTPLQLLGAYAGCIAGILSSGSLRKSRLKKEIAKYSENHINSDGLLKVL